MTKLSSAMSAAESLLRQDVKVPYITKPVCNSI